MTAAFRIAALAVVASALGAAPRARAQTQPPPFSGPDSAPAAVPPPRPAAPRSPEARKPEPPPPPEARKADPRPPALAAADDDTDDPKVSRRLGPRITVPPPPKRAAPPPVEPIAPAPLPAPAPLTAAPPPPPPPRPEAEASTPTVVHAYEPREEATFRPSLPRFKLGLRRFNFVRIGASDSPGGVAAPETFNSVGFDVYPMSNVLRIGLSTAYGWQSGTFLANGDYFATQSFSFGAQVRDLGRVVPFAEAFSGVGYMRRLQFDRTVPTAFWQFGADAGAEIYVARIGYLSLAVGYLRPINGFAKRQQFTSIFVDTWSFKLGVGI